jgi:hypothetical protein
MTKLIRDGIHRPFEGADSIIPFGCVCLESRETITVNVSYFTSILHLAKSPSPALSIWLGLTVTNSC